MQRMLLAAAALAPVLMPSSALAKTQDFQQWATVQATIAATSNIRIQNEFVARFSDNRQGLYEIENITLVGYKLNDHVAVWAGYVHNPQYNAGEFTVMERRAREQMSFDNIVKIGKSSLSARIRLEQRWRDNIGGTGWRLRPYVKIAMPLGGKTAPTLTISNESFLNLNNTSFQTVDGLDRMRTAATLSFPLSKVLKFEAGYLNQHRFVRGGADLNDHVLTGAINLSL